VATVANLGEYPSAVCGSFDADFLDLPDPVLITAMKEHQRYFAVYDEKSRLMPNFVAVNNTIARDESLVRKGHERVLRARLSDAAFFFKEDRKRPLGDRIEDLKGVIYQAELGTSYAKVQRFSRLAKYLAEMVLPDKLDDVKTTARLCKCDLVTHMVTEFPGLQGIIGTEYARMEGYPEEVCLAIHEHYLPAGAEGQLPTSKIGALVSLADRMDTIAGCFAVGLTPSGNTDPFALRRHALAIMRILEETEWDLSLSAFIEESLSILREKIGFDSTRVLTEVADFFRERYRHMMLRSGYESDPIVAVISVAFDRICGLRSRIDQLKKFASESDEFQALALTFKRVNNILKKQKKSFEVSHAMFKETCEFSLWETYQALKDDVYGCLERKEYYEALNLMARLRKPVDEFFDGVEVLTKDNKLRENRVGLLQHLSHLFLSVADFSKFSI
jgi:glycyl-tRNA synthetase beta chain